LNASQQSGSGLDQCQLARLMLGWFWASVRDCWLFGSNDCR
jgi:hypothetical protein